MTQITISTRIIEHERVYRMAGVEVPPYRITCKEHKELVDTLKHMIVKPRFADEVGFTAEPFTAASVISEYYGVKLEVVMIVDAYL